MPLGSSNLRVSVYIFCYVPFVECPVALEGGNLVSLKVHFSLGMKKATGEFEVQQAPWGFPLSRPEDC